VLLAVACARRQPPPRSPTADAPPPTSIDAPPPATAVPDVPQQPPAPAAPDDVTPRGTIARDDLDRALARGPGWLLRELAPEPERADGRFVGWRIGAVFPDAPELCAAGCDLRTGDVIVSVEGWPVEALSMRVRTSLDGTPRDVLQIPSGQSRFVIRLSPGETGQLTLDATALECGAHRPYHDAAFEALAAAGASPSARKARRPPIPSTISWRMRAPSSPP
jgi:hypothetical protein